MKRAVLMLVIALIFTPQTRAQDARYAIFDIPIGGINSGVRGIAPDGTVLAYSGNRNVFWKNGRIVEDLEIGNSEAVNASLDVVCGPPGSNGGSRLRLHDGQVIELGTLGGESSWAYDLNDLGQIVGLAQLPDGHPDHSHFFIWDDGQMTDIGLFGTSGQPRAINNHAQVVGYFKPDGSNSNQPFFWEDGVFTALPTLGDPRPAFAHDINDDGVAVGVANVSIYEHAIKWINGEVFDLQDVNNVRWSSALAINNLGVIAGVMNQNFGQGGVGFITEGDDHMTDLNVRLPPFHRYNIDAATGLNDSGQVIGGDSEHSVGVVLSPVTPTLLLNDPTPGTAGSNNRLILTGATPGKRIYFVCGYNGGGMAIPGCDLQTRAAAQINNPILIGTVVADQQGRASVTRLVPTSVRGRHILIQAIQKDGCKVSQLVSWRFD